MIKFCTRCVATTAFGEPNHRDWCDAISEAGAKPTIFQGAEHWAQKAIDQRMTAIRAGRLYQPVYRCCECFKVTFSCWRTPEEMHTPECKHKTFDRIDVGYIDQLSLGIKFDDRIDGKVPVGSTLTQLKKRDYDKVDVTPPAANKIATMTEINKMMSEGVDAFFDKIMKPTETHAMNEADLALISNAVEGRWRPRKGAIFRVEPQRRDDRSYSDTIFECVEFENGAYAARTLCGFSHSLDKRVRLLTDRDYNFFPAEKLWAAMKPETPKAVVMQNGVTP